MRNLQIFNLNWKWEFISEGNKIDTLVTIRKKGSNFGGKIAQFMHTWNFKMFTKKHTNFTSSFSQFPACNPSSGESVWKGWKKILNYFLCVFLQNAIFLNIPLAKEHTKSGRYEESHTVWEQEIESVESLFKYLKLDKSLFCFGCTIYIRRMMMSEWRECVKGWEMAGSRGFTKTWKVEWRIYERTRRRIFSARAKMNFSICSRKINICKEEILWTWLIDFRDSMNLHRQSLWVLQLQRPLGMEIARTTTEASIQRE